MESSQKELSITFDNMIEFGLKHRHSSGWHKKFPRQKVENGDFKHLGMHEHLKFRNEYFDGRHGYLSWKDLDKFFEANLGKNVDDVFSEFVKRAKRFDHDENLRKEFYDALDPDTRWRSKYIVDSQNRIARYVKKEPKGIITRELAINYNKMHLPESFKPYMHKNELTYIGHFYVRDKGWRGKWCLIPIFITNKDWYDTVIQIGFGKEHIKYSNMTRIAISVPKERSGYYNSEDIVGVPSRGYETIYEKTGRSIEMSNGYTWDLEQPIHIPYTFRRDSADYIFLAKGFDWYAY